jgi:hypothetical protein
MEVHDPPDYTRYCRSAAERIEFLSFSPATGLQKLNFRVADKPPSDLIWHCEWMAFIDSQHPSRLSA